MRRRVDTVGDMHQVWQIDEVAPDFHHRARPIGAPTTAARAAAIAQRRAVAAERRQPGTLRFVVVPVGEIPSGESTGPAPGFDDETLMMIAEGGWH